MDKPLVSVIMSVYNPNIDDFKIAIMSILNQTYSNFEFIIIDDGSEIDLQTIIDTFEDDRIIFLKNEKNKGLPANLNKAIVLANGEYIARMDDDDISLPERFQKQVEYLETNKNIGVLGSYAITIGASRRLMKTPITHNDIKAKTIFRSPMIHPTVMFRSSVIKGNLYDEKYKRGQDYELWSRLVWKTEFANLDQILLKYRMREAHFSKYLGSDYQSSFDSIRKKMLLAVNKDFDDFNLNLILKSSRDSLLTKTELRELLYISNDLIIENKKQTTYNEESLIKALSENLDKALYIYSSENKKLPIKNMKLSPYHSKNRYYYRKYLGKFASIVKDLFK